MGVDLAFPEADRIGSRVKGLRGVLQTLFSYIEYDVYGDLILKRGGSIFYLLKMFCFLDLDTLFNPSCPHV